MERRRGNAAPLFFAIVLDRSVDERYDELRSAPGSWDPERPSLAALLTNCALRSGVGVVLGGMEGPMRIARP
jgi:hypothetical protein